MTYSVQPESEIAGCFARGLPGMRLLMRTLGFQYAADALPPLPASTPDGFFAAPPLRIATVFDQVSVYLLTLGQWDARQHLLLHRHLCQCAPHFIAFVSNKERTDWKIVIYLNAGADTFQHDFTLNDMIGTTVSVVRALAVSDTCEALSAYLEQVTSAIGECKPNPAPDKTKVKEAETPDNSIAWWLQIVGRYPLLDARYERKLLRAVERGNAWARDILVLSNLRLVFNIAKNYQWSGIPLSDLVQEGNLGLIRAIDRFDGAQQGRLSTYATFWIKQALGRCVEQQMRLIRLPAYLQEDANCLQKMYNRLKDVYEREPTMEEVAAATHIPLDKARRILSASSTMMLSLDYSYNEGASSLYEVLSSPLEQSPHFPSEKEAHTNEIISALCQFKPREREIMRLRFGFTEDNEPMSLEQVANAVHLSRERVRQIEAEVLRKLAHRDRYSVLRDTIGGISPLPLPRSRHDREVIPLSPVGVHGELRQMEEQSASRTPVGIEQHKTNNVVENVVEEEVIVGSSFGSVPVASCPDPPPWKSRLPPPQQEVVQMLIARLEGSTSPVGNICPDDTPAAPPPAVRETSIGRTCANCHQPVSVKPTLGGVWYRCVACGDARRIMEQMTLALDA